MNTTTTQILQSNERVRNAIACCRIDRNAATICEVRDALLFRHTARSRGLTQEEEAAFFKAYLATSAGH